MMAIGKYSAKVIQNGKGGSYIACVMYDNCVLRGYFRHYATEAAAIRNAQKMLAKAAA
jgi:hypothetical protein